MQGVQGLGFAAGWAVLPEVHLMRYASMSITTRVRLMLWACVSVTLLCAHEQPASNSSKGSVLHYVTDCQRSDGCMCYFFLHDALLQVGSCRGSPGSDSSWAEMAALHMQCSDVRCGTKLLHCSSVKLPRAHTQVCFCLCICAMF